MAYAWIAESAGGLAVVMCLVLLAGFALRYGLQRALRIDVPVIWAPILGVLAVPTLYSLAQSQGPTVSLGIVAVCLAWVAVAYRDTRKNDAQKQTALPARAAESWSAGLALVAYTLIGFGWAVAFNFSWLGDGPLPLALDTDLAYYALLTQSLELTGVETYYPDTLTGNVSFAAYHYVELWMTLLVKSITGVRTYAVQQLIIGPLFVAITAYAGFLLSRNVFGEKSRFHWALGMVLLLLTQLDWAMLFSSDFTRGSAYFSMTPLGLSGTAFKQRPLLLAAVVAVCLAQMGKRRESVAVLLLFPFINPSTALAIYGAGGLLLGWAIVSPWLSFVRGINRVRIEVDYVLLFIVSICVYGALTWASSDPEARPFVLPDFSRFAHLRTMVNIAGKTSLQFVSVNLVLIYLGWAYRKKIGPALWVFGLIYVAGLAGWMLLFRVINSVQLFSTTTTTLSLALLFWLLCLELYSAPKMRKVLALGVILLCSTISGLHIARHYLRSRDGADAVFDRSVLTQTLKASMPQRGLFFYETGVLQRYDIWQQYDLNQPLRILYWVAEPMAFALANPSEIAEASECFPKASFIRDRTHLMRFRSQHSIPSDSAAWLPFIREQRINYLVTSGRENLHYLDRFDIESRIVSADSSLAIAWLRKPAIRP